MGDADIESDDDEIDDRIRVHRFTHRASCKAKVNRGKGGKTKKAKGPADVCNETRSVIGQKMDTMVEMNDDVIKQTDEDSSVYLSSGSLASDVTSDDGASSEIDDVFVEENDFLFIVSLSWITHVNISVAFALLWAFVDIDRKMENVMDVFGHDDDGKAVVDRKETVDHTPSGHQEDGDVMDTFGHDDDGKAVIDRKETGDHTPSGHPTDDEYPPDFETDSETDIDQPSTSYKRDKHATYDFIVRKRFMDVSSDEYIW
ncbi:uncharacterized protein LOC115926786 [Strongylocentrotus purpuratus]|uniref:Uncharacterized protein n=1 Tax=Strongylocentrotus purpuratus TaxID=7668 RepID=A0A7M7P9C9_STRPU|nr:uncharacterized protein LOC115926786 [Strongylocentrotus purpuratus]